MDLQRLRNFRLERILNLDAYMKSVNLLGTLPAANDTTIPAILLLQKTPFDFRDTAGIAGLLDRVDPIETNDIYHWLLGWFGAGNTSAPPDIKINVIAPATSVHIQKYSTQSQVMVSETPVLYREVTLPYITSVPPSRTQWVYNILNHITEAEHILFEDPSPSEGFILLPDLKWDRRTLSALYLVAIAHSSDIRSIRDLRKFHIPMLRSIKQAATRVAFATWGLQPGRLRFYIHYQPSYYQFHVHIVTTEYTSLSGMNVGQAHLLDDVISLLELEEEDKPILERMVLTYTLGENHGLYELMKAAGAITEL